MKTLFLDPPSKMPMSMNFENLYENNEHFKALTESFGISLEELKMADTANSNERFSLVLTESEKSGAEDKLQDLREEINRYKAKAVEKGDLAKVFAWWGLGLYLAGLLTMSAPALAILFFISSIIFSILSIVNSQEAIKYSKKLLASRSKLKALKRRTKDKKTVDRIDDLLDRIDENHKSLGYDIHGTN